MRTGLINKWIAEHFESKISDLFLTYENWVDINLTDSLNILKYFSSLNIWKIIPHYDSDSIQNFPARHKH